MKRFLCILLAAAALFSLSGCTVDTTGMDFKVITDPDTAVYSYEEDLEGDFDEEDLTGDFAETPLPTEDESASQAASSAESPDTAAQDTAEAAAIDENGSYTTCDDVALYIHTYGKLPQNFITKKEAQALGWGGGSLEPYAPGKCIGGTRFGNYEGLLPEKEGRTYTECDIDTLGKDSRGAKRIVFSNDGLIYYTEDHYSSFTLLYGEE